MSEETKYFTMSVEPDGRNGIETNMTPEEVHFWAGVAQQLVLTRSFDMKPEE